MRRWSIQSKCGCLNTIRRRGMASAWKEIIVTKDFYIYVVLILTFDGFSKHIFNECSTYVYFMFLTREAVPFLRIYFSPKIRTSETNDGVSLLRRSFLLSFLSLSSIFKHLPFQEQPVGPSERAAEDVDGLAGCERTVFCRHYLLVFVIVIFLAFNFHHFSFMVCVSFFSTDSILSFLIKGAMGCERGVSASTLLDFFNQLQVHIWISLLIVVVISPSLLIFTSCSWRFEIHFHFQS